MLEVTNDMEKVLENYAVVYFTAPWCGPCVALKPQFARAGTIDSLNQYYIIDVDQIDKSYLDEFKLQSVPHIFIMKDRRIVSEITAKTADKIIDQVNNV